MRYCNFKFSLRLCCFFICIFLNGCASNQGENISSGSAPEGDLRYMGPDICRELKTGRMWQVERSGLFDSQQGAEEYAAGLKLGGHSDWRLPTQKELFRLYYIYFWDKNGECRMELDGEYWIAADKKDSMPGRWTTDYLCGPVHKYVNALKKKGYVRAVRP